MSDDSELFAARRAAVLAEMRRQGGGVMLLPAADEKLRNNDAEYLFRQDSDHYYLTGFDEPLGCAVLIADPEPRDGAGGSAKQGSYALFVRPRDKEREVWTGLRAGVEGAKEVYQADAAYLISEMDAKLAELLNHRGSLWFKLGADEGWDRRVIQLLSQLRLRQRAGAYTPRAVVDPGRILHEQRLFKSAAEVALLRRACAITAEAHVAAMRGGGPGRREYEVQADIEYAFRRGGASGPGYGTIVAGGANSCILHYRAGDAVLKAGDVCLVDAGAEYRFYTADVSRTFPVSGRFSAGQRKLYELCLEAQLDGIAAVKPGTTVDAVHELTVRRLVEGLVRLGLLQGGVEERIADQSFRKYYMHRTSHWLGMDVHDVGAYYGEDGKARPLVAGMVLTVEPGLYVPADDAQAPEELRGVGIRIEDDVLVTPEGREVLTAAVPKGVSEVEAACGR
jgi:Xaa-Pro aminopeptidase